MIDEKRDKPYFEASGSSHMFKKPQAIDQADGGRAHNFGK